MATQLHEVDSERCTGDGLCAEVCPRQALEVVDETARSIENRAGLCISCGQCVAVCPTEALRMPRFPGTDFHRLEKPTFGYEELLHFLQSRRSVRVFKDQPVEREVIERILEAAATAPMGLPPHSTEVVVIATSEEREFLLAELVADYESILSGFRSPIGRTVIRLSKGAEVFNQLDSHVVDTARRNNEAYRADGSDHYMYRAPVLMLFHGSRWAMSVEESAHLVCHHAMLAALSLGLGSTIIGLVPPIVERSKTLRARYGIGKDHRVLTSLILGYPRYRYRRGISRRLAGVRYH
jgi:nitroreductase/NAD-dependent dihydropyrimidine dehydrogenase PreA subunit